MNERATLNPLLAGLSSGAIAALVAALVSIPLRSPDDLIANTFSVTVAALAIGIADGYLWRELQRSGASSRAFYWTNLGGFLVAVIALTLADAFFLDRFIEFGVPLAAIIFGTAAVLTPILSRLTLPAWVAGAGILVVLGLGIALAGIGDTESGELTLEDLPTTTTQGGATTAVAGATTTSATPSTLSVPDDLAETYSVTQGIATYTVPETLRGFAAEAVGVTEELSGNIVPGGPSEFTLDLTTFETDQSRRDRVVQEIFGADPLAVFRVDSFDLPPQVQIGEVINLLVNGEMTINGVSRPLTWVVEARVDGADIAVTGETDITLTEFAIDPPNVAGLVTVEDRAHLEVLFLAVPIG